jgi:hypothetical protein
MNIQALRIVQCLGNLHIFYSILGYKCYFGIFPTSQVYPKTEEVIRFVIMHAGNMLDHCTMTLITRVESGSYFALELDVSIGTGEVVVTDRTIAYCPEGIVNLLRSI